MDERLERFITTAEQIAGEVKETFGGLNAKQLNWKPSAEKWSVAQCLDHLIVSNKLEFPAIEDALKDGYRNPFWSKPPFFSKLCGNFLIGMVKPGNNKRFKAPKSFRPAQSNIDAGIVDDFVANQEEVIRLFKMSECLDLDRVKIVSPIGSFFTYSLRDALLTIVLHERRHFQQAERVMQVEGFPRN